MTQPTKSAESNPWVQTFSGLAFDLIEPSPKMVVALDLGMGLSRQVRFNGHAEISISVAQHSVLVGLAAAQAHKEGMFPQEIPLPVAVAWALLHDAAEAYIGDVASPVRRAMKRGNAGTQEMFSAFDQLDDRVSETIWEWAGLSPWTSLPVRETAWKVIKQIDFGMLAFEKKWFVRVEEPKPWNAMPDPFKFADFGIDVDSLEGLRVATEITRSWDECEASDMFISALVALHLCAPKKLFRNLDGIPSVKTAFMATAKRFHQISSFYSV